MKTFAQPWLYITLLIELTINEEVFSSDFFHTCPQSHVLPVGQGHADQLSNEHAYHLVKHDQI